MKIINFGETRSVINQYMSELRDINVQTDRARFRNNLRRIGQLMAYEVSKVLTYSPSQFRHRSESLLSIRTMMIWYSAQYSEPVCLIIRDFLIFSTMQEMRLSLLIGSIRIRNARMSA